METMYQNLTEQLETILEENRKAANSDTMSARMVWESEGWMASSIQMISDIDGGVDHLQDRWTMALDSISTETDSECAHCRAIGRQRAYEYALHYIDYYLHTDDDDHTMDFCDLIDRAQFLGRYQTEMEFVDFLNTVDAIDSNNPVVLYLVDCIREMWAGGFQDDLKTACDTLIYFVSTYCLNEEV